ncbi:MAG: glycosyltransferase [Thermoguttaceae bacterium]
MLRLSIIVPLLGEPSQLDDTLVSVLENRPANCEVLVVHRGRYDDPYGLAGEVRFIEADSGATLAECLNLGLRASRAPVVHVLRCGVEVTPGWAEAAVGHFRDAEVAGVAAVVVSTQEPRQIVSAGVGYRAEGVAWPLDEGAAPDRLEECQNNLCGPDILAGFYCRSTIESLGGFSSHAADMLIGIDAALAIRQAGFRCVVEPNCVAHAGNAIAPARPGFRHGHDAERLFWRWASAHGWCRSLAGHAALVAGECAIGLGRPLLFLQLLGRLLGVIRAASARRNSKPREFASTENPAVIPIAEFDAARPSCQRSSNAA